MFSVDKTITLRMLYEFPHLYSVISLPHFQVLRNSQGPESGKIYTGTDGNCVFLNLQNLQNKYLTYKCMKLVIILTYHHPFGGQNVHFGLTE